MRLCVAPAASVTTLECERGGLAEGKVRGMGRGMEGARKGTGRGGEGTGRGRVSVHTGKGKGVRVLRGE